MATTTHWLPKRSAASRTSSGRASAAVLSDTLSAPARRSPRTSSIERMPPPTVSGMQMPSAVRRTTSSMIARASCEAVMSRKTSSSAPCVSYASAASTGSPASRRSTKRTPLTTRPSLTSRHGMTRLANIIVTSAVRPVHAVGGVPWARRGSVRPRHLASFRQLLPRLGEVDHAGVEGAAHDAAYDARYRGQPPQVVEPRDTAGGDDRDPGRTRELRCRLDVRPLPRAVAADVRVEERGNVALIAERQGEFDRRELGEINPPLHRHPTVARVRRDDDPLRESVADLGEELGLERARADDGPRRPGPQHRFHRSHVAQPAARLDRHRRDSRDDLRDERGLARLAGERAVEVHDMEPLGTALLPVHGHRDRVFGEDGLSVGAALTEPHASPVAEVDGGDHDHRAPPLTIAAKFSRSRSPHPL